MGSIYKESMVASLQNIKYMLLSINKPINKMLHMSFEKHVNGLNVTRVPKVQTN